MERLSPLDASFLHIEDAVSHMHIGSVAIFEGPPPSLREPCARWCERSCRSCRATARRCGSCRSSSAGRCGSTTRTSTSATTCATPRCPHPGGDDELRNLVGRVMSQQLDRDEAAVGDVDGRGPRGRPLGAAVQGPPLHGRRRLGRRAAVGGARRRARTPEPPASRRLAARSAEPIGAELAARGAGRARDQPLRAAARVAPLPARRARAPSAQPRRRRASLTMRGVLRPPPASSLNGPIGPHRRWAWARSQLSDIKRVRAGARRHGQRRRARRDHGRLPRPAASRGEPVDRVVRTLVPVSVRSAERAGRRTTTACRRCSPTCRSASPTRSSGSARSARRWTA